MRGRVKGEGREAGKDAGLSRVFKEPESSPCTQVLNMGIIMWGVIRADGDMLPWASVKNRGMPSLCIERFFIKVKGEGDLTRFS